ncbi:hypothetical protein JMJ35_001013 [Cladonia borealis]|uniref:Acetyl-CoA synthetase-like protein n=1 Tax=Cladonia borealis TaxID=184061 RepID=A0AA39R9R6_9LECA|nr:hypothetical protein JMJ35_001013 [Cladonia borealis]
MASTFPDLPIFRAIASHDPHSTAIIHSRSARRFTYGELLKDVEDAKVKLYEQLKTASPESIGGQRVAFLVENGYDYVVTLLSIFACDSIAVPMSSSFPAIELRYILENSEAVALLSSRKFQDKAEETLKEGLEHIPKKPLLSIVEKRRHGSGHDEVQLVHLPMKKGGMMLYTSGTTSRPKGVLLPERVLTAQAQSLQKAWEYTTRDHLLHVLPLHHIHGTVNALLTPLFAGSTIEFLFPFNVDAVWERLAAPFLADGKSKEPITFLTVVPTVYHRFLSSYDNLPDPTKEAVKKALAPENLRLNISGSAALPTPTKKAWTELSGGNVLLERYGMTEVGMALSCGLDFKDRVDGSVGWPLPSVQVRLVDSESNEVIPLGQEVDKDGKEREGEIQLRGPTIFEEYWRNEKATAEEFVEADDGGGKWFKTGDVATRRIVEGAGQSGQEWAKGPMYFIRGRKSTDIIKTGGEKVSALEIERELLSLPQVSEAAVVGIKSEQWGQKVAAVVVLNPAQAQTGKGGKTWSVHDMRRALKDKLVAYKVPQELKIVEEIPKNAMGKINKKALVKEIFGADA